MVLSVWLKKADLWIARALHQRVTSEEVLGGKTTLQNEVVKILDRELRSEYQEINGDLPNSNPSRGLSQSYASRYLPRKKQIILKVPERFVELVESLERQVSEKRKAGVPTDIAEELLSLIDDSLTKERRVLWLENAEKMGYNINLKELIMDVETAKSLGREYYFDKVKKEKPKNVLDASYILKDSVVSAFGEKIANSWHNGVTQAYNDDLKTR